MVRHSGNTTDRKIAVSDGGRDFSRPYCVSLIAMFIAIISLSAIVVVVTIREKNHERSRSKASFTFPEADRSPATHRDEERQKSVLGVAPSIHVIARQLMDKALKEVRL